MSVCSLSILGGFHKNGSRASRGTRSRSRTGSACYTLASRRSALRQRFQADGRFARGFRSVIRGASCCGGRSEVPAKARSLARKQIFFERT
jgi:hypothetical protein